MSDNVVPLGKVYTTGAPVTDVVNKLQDWLERAERGEILGIAACFVDGGGGLVTGWVGGTAQAGMLVAGTSMLSYRIRKETDDNCRE